MAVRDNGEVTDRLERDGHPVITGLIALVGVALVVGVIAGVAALAGARVVGLDGSGPTTDSGQEDDGASLILPRPEPTEAASGPLITLAPGQESASSGSSDDAEADDGEQGKKGKKNRSAKPISLQLTQATVSPMENIDLTGVYPEGEGAILQVQRFEAGSWQDFPVTVSVRDGTFTTYVQTGQAGPNRFRMVDTDSGTASNEVKVTIG